MKIEVFRDDKFRLQYKNPIQFEINIIHFFIYESALVTYSSIKDTVLNEWSVLSFKYSKPLTLKLKLQMYFDKEKLL
jgi:hypothetical protein